MTTIVVFSERLMEVENMHEEVYEQRMELLVNSVRKTVRRRAGLDIFLNNNQEINSTCNALLERKVKVRRLLKYWRIIKAENAL